MSLKYVETEQIEEKASSMSLTRDDVVGLLFFQLRTQIQGHSCELTCASTLQKENFIVVRYFQDVANVFLGVFNDFVVGRRSVEYLSHLGLGFSVVFLSDCFLCDSFEIEEN